MNKSSGFTLLELMIVVTVLAILLGIAIPSFVETIRQSAVRSQANELLALMHFARTEAIKRRAEIVVDVTATIGWKANIKVKADDEVLRVIDKSDSNVGVSAAQVTFDLRGRPVGGSACFNLSYSSHKRRIVLGVGGAMVVESGACGVTS